MTLLLVAVAVGASIAIPASPALAQSSLGVDRATWFSSSNSDITGCSAGKCEGFSGTGGLLFPPVGQGYTVPTSPGHMLVAVKNGSSDSRAYIHFNTSSIPSGSTISSFVATLTTSTPTDTAHDQEHAKFSGSDPRGKPPATSNESVAGITACMVTEPFGDNLSGGGGGDPPTSTVVDQQGNNPPTVSTTVNEPAYDCAFNARGVQSSNGLSWSFDLTRMAQAWFNPASGRSNEGIALLPVVTGLQTTWQVELHGPALSLTNSTGGTDTRVTYVTPAEAPVAKVDFTAASSGGCAGCGGGITPPIPQPDIPPPPVGPLPTEQPTIQPSVLGEQFTQTPPVTAVAFHGKTPWWLWLCIVLVLAGAYVVKNSIGVDRLADELAPAGRANRVASVLQRRRLAGGRASRAAEAIKAEALSEE